ncbi:hypothetical protein [uncultured Polaribacter sp.]|uniref:hypothetical protein n=1 Tax=uncultured Polaribacter sp. TaxID=174711 RepID=UPI0030D8FF29
MKNLTLLLVFIFISTATFAQKRNKLTGPAFKNFKPWMQKSAPTLVFKNDTKKSLLGSEFKNHKVWENKKENLELVTFVRSRKTDLTGPSFKNYKH